MVIMLFMLSILPSEKLFGEPRGNRETMEKIDRIYEEISRSMVTDDTVEIWNKFLDSLWENREIREIVYMPNESTGVIEGRRWAPPSYFVEFLIMNMKASKLHYIKDESLRCARVLEGIENRLIREYLWRLYEGYKYMPPETTVVEREEELQGEYSEICEFLPEIRIERWYERRMKGWFMGIALFNSGELPVKVWWSVYREIEREEVNGNRFYLVVKENGERFILESKSYKVLYQPIKEGRWVIFWEEGEKYTGNELLFNEIKRDNKYFPEMIEKGLIGEWKDASLGYYIKEKYGDRLWQIGCYSMCRKEKGWYIALFKPILMRVRIGIYGFVIRIKEGSVNFLEKMPFFRYPLFIFLFVSFICFLIGYLIIKLKTFKKGGKDV